MSTTSSGGTTADVAVEQYLSNHSGWHTVQQIATATGYSTGHVRSTAHDLADNGTISRRKNRNKPVIGYNINGDWKVPGNNKPELRRLIRVHASSVPSNLMNMSVNALQNKLEKVADGKAPLEHKLEFRKP